MNHVAVVFCAAVALSLAGCGSDSAEPLPPTIAVGSTATLSGTIPPLTGHVSVTVASQPAVLNGDGTWQAQVPLSGGSASAEIRLLLENQEVAKRLVTVGR